MNTLTISPKFQIVIPKPIRETLDLRAGDKIQAVVYNRRIELIPIAALDRMRGFLRGIDTTIEREGDRL